MIKCAVIGASKEAIPMIAIAKKLGLYTIGLDGNSNAEGLKHVDESIIMDIKDIKAVAKVLSEKGISLLLPVPVGFILTTAGYVNDMLGLKGISYDAALRCADKYIFAKILEEAGLRYTRTILLDSDTDCESINYPIIVKPRFGSGSKMVKIIFNSIELKNFIKDNAGEEELIVEKILPGIEHGIDGVVIDGKVQITLLRRKIISKPPHRQALVYSSVVRSEECNLYERVTDYFQKVVDVIGISNSIIHADLMVTDEEIFVIEMAGRPSGHNINSIFLPLATHMNLIEEYIKYSLGEKYNFMPAKYELIAESFFNFEQEKILSVPDQSALNKDWILDYHCSIKPGDIMQTIIDGNSIVGRGSFIVGGLDNDSLQKNVLYVHSLFETSAVR